MTTSTTIGALAAALAKAQAQLRNASKDAENPHYKSRYASLAAVLDAAREPLAAHGLAVTQLPSLAGSEVSIETILLHASGEWLSSTLLVPTSKRDAQGIGSAISYGRRYALAAMIGLAQADDDAEEATQPTKNPPRPPETRPQHRVTTEAKALAPGAWSPEEQDRQMARLCARLRDGKIKAGSVGAAARHPKCHFNTTHLEAIDAVVHVAQSAERKEEPDGEAHELAMAVWEMVTELEPPPPIVRTREPGEEG
jgi:hypothetical protein